MARVCVLCVNPKAEVPLMTTGVLNPIEFDNRPATYRNHVPETALALEVALDGQRFRAGALVPQDDPRPDMATAD